MRRFLDGLLCWIQITILGTAVMFVIFNVLPQAIK